MKVSISLCALFLLAVVKAVRAESSEAVQRLPAGGTNSFYINERAPLARTALLPLPSGAIQPRGWLRVVLERQRDGLTGQLGEISSWLQKEDNAWLSKTGKGKYGWEELPYWLRGYIELAYVFDDAKMKAEAQGWIEGVLASQRPDGDFGPDQHFEDGSRDFWANMIMLYCLETYYDRTSDQRVLKLMTDYFHHQNSVPDEKFLTHYWQHVRGGDDLYSVLWLYNRTGDSQLLELAKKIHRRTANWTMTGDLPDWHNVNVAQSFREPAEMALLTLDPAQTEATYADFRLVRTRFGQVPGGMFGGDEVCRKGFADPRQATETCGFVEQMLSDEILFQITGDPSWGDQCETVAFNSYPAAVMPDFKSLRYLTAPNMVLSDAKNHAPGIANSGPFLMMNPFSSRCCQHNHSQGWPYFSRNLWMATADNGLCATLYSACEVTAQVGKGELVSISEETHYPFEENLRFTLSTRAPVEFPLSWRIPGWCKSARLSVNGEFVSVKPVAGEFIRVNRRWKNGDKIALELPMAVNFRSWTNNQNSVSVDYGALTFSLRIGERYEREDSTKTAIGDSSWQKKADPSQWPSYEIHPTTAWNYGLVWNGDNPAAAFKISSRAWPENNFPFTLDDVPITITAKAQKIPQWGLDRFGLCAPLQASPAFSREPVEMVELVPMGAARLRISAFPTVTDDAQSGHEWQASASPKASKFEASASHCFEGDTVEALGDGIIPASSSDQNVPRFSWWPHTGSREWVQFDFGEPKTISQSAVYWFDDTGVGRCRVPASARLLYKSGDEWKVVPGGEIGVKPDMMNRITFAPITTTALRVDTQLQPQCSGGILEWEVPGGLNEVEGSDFRPPAVPLVACDPYFSIWSQADKLTGANTTHWTGRAHRLTSMIRIDGKPYRLMGKDVASAPALQQTSLEVLPTRTIYTFAGQGITVTLTFMTAVLPEDLDLLSRPVTYLSWSARALDGKAHQVSVYFDASAELTVENLHSEVTCETEKAGDLAVTKFGSVDQPILATKGDSVRIDWGYLYVAAPGLETSSAITAREFCESNWAATGALPVERNSKLATNFPATATVAAFALNFGSVTAKPATRWLMVAYDDEYSIQYMKHNLRPYWRRDGTDMPALLKKCAVEYESLCRRCEKFDAELMADLVKAGGEDYARLCALAYRTCFAAGKFVADANGQPLQFCKENHSNGCIATSDVFYPMSPQFLLFGPTLAKSFVVPFMNYAASERWKFPFAPHDLGRYPQANGQVYGDGERGVNNQMPVEESGNLLLLFGAISQMDGNANFAGLYWKQLTQWAEYLKSKGFDPENQLCTDDFAGHLAHNVNLSAKAVVALGAFGRMCEMHGDTVKAAEFTALAKSFADRWVKEARQGDHFRLAFDQPGTWSQKYNLVWDRILGLNLFPAAALQEEMNFYKRTQNRYGLPLDNRRGYTKLDWTLWTATLTQDRADFDAIFEPVYRFINETPDRSPLTDWYETGNARKVGFTARPVVGGVFLQMLYNREVWQKWARRDLKQASGWAPIPKLPKMITIVPAADQAEARWHFTTLEPENNWAKTGFDDSKWKESAAGFGAGNPLSPFVKTPWATPDIWLRRQVEIPATSANLKLWMAHDEDAEVFINGVLAARAHGFTTSYEAFPLLPGGRSAIKPGMNLVAIHCHQTTGAQYIDAGFIETTDNE